MKPRLSWSELLTLIAFLASAAALQSSVIVAPLRTRAYLNPPPEFVERFSFGFPESMADSLWLRWIQDGEACQTYEGASIKDAKPIAVVDASLASPRHKQCDNSWSYKMLDATTKLAPKFKMPYLAGAMTLSVLTEDYAGATLLFERGIENYPNDWMILYRASYHFLFDLQDLPKAAELLTRAGDHGGPYWLKLLAARLYTKAGQAALGLATLEAYLKTIDREDRRIEVRLRIEKLKAELARAKRAPAEGP